ncbi:hypothetical protein AYO21_04055 [Fonsecaea monophora]|uniref:FAD/NAD(P)-binding domain-containing protein n=1 Tax=Fonsecaea monophora TaxID=254056 RepID=A0A177FD23_9EURO|nr:hypothetical protein AYO21_04055 [Fonsecaea monophora]KAH0845024.1 putative sterigmatocystin biosynthesis monooxygenase stcW [Fonsecaea pedrosoi]OAG41591.1 hypothetical protein AYO21_04055 [Fonsecaea monophora]
MADTILPDLRSSGTQPGGSQPIKAQRHLRVICVGAGASGLLFAYKLQRSFDDFSLVLYEKNGELGGTWFENRYPGCACDIPAHTYTWSFEPKHDWSAVYAGSREIYQYFNDFSDKYKLRRYVRVKHQVTGARWDEKEGTWDVTVQDLLSGKTFPDRCDILVNAGGILNAWQWPRIPGLQSFKGPLLHSANWDDKTVLEGKTVGLIGNGSSGIQILPAIRPIAKKVTTFIREPTWVSPVQGLEGRTYSREERESFARDKGKLLEYRKGIESALNSQFAIFLQNTQVQRDTRQHMQKQMSEKLHDPVLEDKLIPKWSVGCRRLTPGIGYLESLKADNIEVVYGEILSITPAGCVCDDGREHPVDVLICATGFDTSFKPRFPVIGTKGKNLQNEWAEEPASYLGIAAPGFPNYFMFLGPNCPIGNGPVLTAIEAQADYILKLINRWQTENIHSMSPKLEAVKDFIAYKDSFMSKTVWHEECRSWYKNNSASGKIAALWPGSTLHYLEAVSDVRGDDWEIEYKGNRFAFLGNGFSQTEVDDTADFAYYIRDHDDGPFLSFKKNLQALNKSGTMAGRAKLNIMVKRESNL